MEDLGIDGSVREKNNKMNLKKNGFRGHLLNSHGLR